MPRLFTYSRERTYAAPAPILNLNFDVVESAEKHRQAHDKIRMMVRRFSADFNKLMLDKQDTALLKASPRGEVRRGDTISIFLTGSKGQSPFHILILYLNFNFYFPPLPLFPPPSPAAQAQTPTLSRVRLTP